MESTTIDPHLIERPRAPRRLLVTGANGYIGRRLVAAACELGYEVVAGVRQPSDFSMSGVTRSSPFDLATPETGDLLHGVDAVIHLAAIVAGNSRPPGVDEDLNVSGTRQLVLAARARGIRRFVFLSSQSAAADSPTSYGRSKWEIEQLLDRPGECSVRTGLVFGGPPRGVYGALYRVVRRLPLLPVIRPEAPVYPIHVDDVCAGLLSLVGDEKRPPRLARLAARRSTPFGEFLRTLARCRLGRRLRLLPIPPRLILAASRLTESIPGLPTIGRDRVLGLLALRPMEAGELPAPRKPLALRDPTLALGLEGQRRRLLAEARTLTRYVVGSPTGPGVLRRYVRAVCADHDREPLDLPGGVLRMPVLLRALEPLGRPESRLRARLSIATRIVEMTVEAAPRFHDYRGRRWIAWPGLIWLLAVDAAFIPLRWLAGRLRPDR